MKIVNLNKLIFLFASAVLISCDSTKIYDAYIAVNPSGWEASKPIEFEVEVDASQDHKFNYVIGLRNNNEYLYANLFLFVATEDPSGAIHTDTLQYLLAEPNGKWKGAGIGAIKHHMFVYKEAQVLTDGIYKFRIAHGMRTDTLFGIEDIGLRIESTN
tara:strand:+ start:496 stop:969 length:474 start_codon:yes stop_codon:yes gene_type:complete